MEHQAAAHTGLGSSEAQGKNTLSGASIVMKSFYPWKDLPPNKSALSFKAQWAYKRMKTKSLWQALFVRDAVML